MTPEERNARVRAVVTKLEALAEEHCDAITKAARTNHVLCHAAIGLALFDAYELGVTDGYTMVGGVKK